MTTTAMPTITRALLLVLLLEQCAWATAFASTTAFLPTTQWLTSSATTTSSSTARPFSSLSMDLEGPSLCKPSPFLNQPGPKLFQGQPFVPRTQQKQHQKQPLDELQRSVRQAETSHGMPWRSSIDPAHQEGPFYMPFWLWQMNFMKKELTNLRALPTRSSTGKDLSYVENSKEGMRMHTIQFQSDEYKLIRLTLLDAGKKTQVFTSLWYPDTKYNLPVLGVDFLQFHGQKHLCISDFQPIQATEEEHDQLYEHVLAPIRAQFPSLQGEMTKRFYDQNEFFSQQMLLGRADGPDEAAKLVQEDLPTAFQAYLRAHVDMVQSTTPQPARAHEIQERHVAYDEYSSARDPAHGLLARQFGQDFADEYVYDILFPLSRQTETASS